MANWTRNEPQSSSQRRKWNLEGKKLNNLFKKTENVQSKQSETLLRCIFFD